MYRLEIDEGGEETAPPALIFVTSPEYLELIRQAEDRQGRIAGQAGALVVEESIGEGGRVDYVGIAVVKKISEGETGLVLPMPEKDLKHGPRHQRIREIAATLSVTTGILNDYGKNHSRLTSPQVSLTTMVSADANDYPGNYMSVNLDSDLVKKINNLFKSDDGRAKLEGQTGRVVTLFAGHLLTGTAPSTVRASIADDLETIGIEWQGGSCELSASGRGSELIGKNVGTPAKQIMLISGLAAMATYATSQGV